MDERHALIFDLYRGTTHDGPGQRDTVFFKGCPLSCTWCHNPEGISTSPLVWWQKQACIGCGLCHDACPTGANALAESGIQIDRDKCTVCGKCALACPAEALTLCGQEWSLEALLEEVLKNKPYYDRTGGGVTVSGGEAMLQYRFVERFFQELHAVGVTTALDTCGHVSAACLARVLPHTDYILYDLKLMNSAGHERFCGTGNGLILENARRIAEAINRRELGGEFWIRTPLIPGASASEENLRNIAAFIVNQLGVRNVARWELCAFNNSCSSKYHRLGKPWDFAGNRALRRAEALSLRQTAERAGFPSEKLFVTGILTE